MKKLFLMLTLVVAASVSLKAQTAFSTTATNPTSAWTNAGADTLNYKLSQSYRVVTVQPLITKVSGTMAGTATLYYSTDGTTYVTTGSSLSLTDITLNSTLWNITSAAKYWRVIVTGGTTLSGTMVAKISATL